MSDYKAQKQCIRLTCSMVFTVIVLFGCASGPDLRPGNPLPGIGLIASQNTILLSWSQDIPIARNLRPGTRINVIAQYDSKFGPVMNEVLASANTVSNVNGVRLSLKNSLNFTPSGKVCMRLAVGKRPIPLRIARLGESSSGFYYDEWESSAALQSKKASLDAQLRSVENNIQNLSRTNPSFVRWQEENQIFSMQQCSSISIKSKQRRPETALEGEDKIRAAKQQCVALYDGIDNIKMPDIEAINSVLAHESSARLSVLQMYRDFKKFKPGKIYFPGSHFPLDQALLDSIMLNKNNLSTVQAGLIVEGYHACKTEALTRFEESLRDWQDVTNSESIAARIAPLQRLCQARFSRDVTRQDRLQEFKVLKNKLENHRLALDQDKKFRLPQRKQLIPHSCAAEGI